MLLKVSNPKPVHVNREDLTTPEEFSFPGSTVRYDRGAGSDFNNRLNKVRNAFRMLNNLWKSSQYSSNTKLKIY